MGCENHKSPTDLDRIPRGSKAAQRYALLLPQLVVLACLSTVKPSPTVGPVLRTSTETVLLPRPTAETPTVMAISPTKTAAIPTPKAPSSEPTVTRLQDLTAHGPWLLIQTKNGFIAMNPDGSGKKVLDLGPTHTPEPLREAVSPAGGQVAYLSASDANIFHNLTLHILELPALSTLMSIPLTSAQTEPGPDLEADTNIMEILRASMGESSLAWSPDGGTLAFIGAMQGSDADLYEYILKTGKTLRLADGPGHAYNPVWSPDGAYIVHPSVVSFNMGGEYTLAGVFASRADGSGNFSLYPVPEGSGNEFAAGWLDSATLVAHSFYMTCGFRDIRLVNLHTRKATSVWEGCFTSAAVAESGGSLLVATEGNFSRYGTDIPAGLYRITLADPQPREILGVPIREVTWSKEANVFLAIASDGSVFEISESGDVQNLAIQAGELPLISPDGKSWVWINIKNGKGIWVGDRPLTGGIASLAHIFSDGVFPGIRDRSLAGWSPDAQSFAFLGIDNILHLIQASDWEVIRVGRVPPARSGWNLAWVSG
jgi:hypothetical protein